MSPNLLTSQIEDEKSAKTCSLLCALNRRQARAGSQGQEVNRQRPRRQRETRPEGRRTVRSRVIFVALDGALDFMALSRCGTRPHGSARLEDRGEPCHTGLLSFLDVAWRDFSVCVASCIETFPRPYSSPRQALSQDRQRAARQEQQRKGAGSGTRVTSSMVKSLPAPPLCSSRLSITTWWSSRRN